VTEALEEEKSKTTFRPFTMNQITGPEGEVKKVPQTSEELKAFHELNRGR